MVKRSRTTRGDSHPDPHEPDKGVGPNRRLPLDGTPLGALSAGSAWGLRSPSKRGPPGPAPDGPGAKRTRPGEPEAQVTRWHVKEEDFEFYGVGRRMPCSVPVHP